MFLNKLCDNDDDDYDILCIQFLNIGLLLDRKSNIISLTLKVAYLLYWISNRWTLLMTENLMCHAWYVN